MVLTWPHGQSIFKHAMTVFSVSEVSWICYVLYMWSEGLTLHWNIWNRWDHALATLCAYCSKLKVSNISLEWHFSQLAIKLKANLVTTCRGCFHQLAYFFIFLYSFYCQGRALVVQLFQTRKWALLRISSIRTSQAVTDSIKQACF